MPGPARTFATSNYKRFYAFSAPGLLHYTFLHAVEKVLKMYVKRINAPLTEAESFGIDMDMVLVMKTIQDDAFKDVPAMKDDVDAMAEYLWSSSKKHHLLKDMEVCSVLNAVIRDDVEEEIRAGVEIFRNINSRRIRRAGDGAASINIQSYPPTGETWRGSSFRPQHRSFFERMVGKKYRVPGFLAVCQTGGSCCVFVQSWRCESLASPCDLARHV